MRTSVEESVYRARSRALALVCVILVIWTALPGVARAVDACGGESPRLTVAAGSELFVTLTGDVDETDEDVVVVEIEELAAVRIEGGGGGDVRIVGSPGGGQVKDSPGGGQMGYSLEGCDRPLPILSDVQLEASGGLVVVLEPGRYLLRVRAASGSGGTYHVRIKALALSGM